MTVMSKILTAAALAAGALTLAACGTTAIQPHAQPVPTASQQDQAQSAVTCTMASSGGNVQVQVVSSSDCGQVQSALAGDGESWHPITALVPVGTTSNGQTMQAECALSKDGATITVEDAGFMGQTYGPALCSGYEQQGWTTP
jgi:hypothetical protein